MTPDNPNIPEGGFMRAAEKAIRDLQDTAVAQGVELARARKDAGWRKVQVRVLGLVSVALVIVCVLGTAQYFHTRNIAARVQQGSITQCVDGNHVRADDVKIWDTFVGILEGSHPTQPVQAEAKAFEGFIAKVDAPKDCTALFGAAAAAADTDAG